MENNRLGTFPLFRGQASVSSVKEMKGLSVKKLKSEVNSIHTLLLFSENPRQVWRQGLPMCS